MGERGTAVVLVHQSSGVSGERETAAVQVHQSSGVWHQGRIREGKEGEEASRKLVWKEYSGQRLVAGGLVARRRFFFARNNKTQNDPAIFTACKLPELLPPSPPPPPPPTHRSTRIPKGSALVFNKAGALTPTPCIDVRLPKGNGEDKNGGREVGGGGGATKPATKREGGHASKEAAPTGNAGGEGGGAGSEREAVHPAVAAAVAAVAGPEDMDACRLEGVLVCRGDRLVGVQVSKGAEGEGCRCKGDGGWIATDCTLPNRGGGRGDGSGCRDWVEGS